MAWFAFFMLKSGFSQKTWYFVACESIRFFRLKFLVSVKRETCETRNLTRKNRMLSQVKLETWDEKKTGCSPSPQASVLCAFSWCLVRCLVGFGLVGTGERKKTRLVSSPHPDGQAEFVRQWKSSSFHRHLFTFCWVWYPIWSSVSPTDG